MMPSQGWVAGRSTKRPENVREPPVGRLGGDRIVAPLTPEFACYGLSTVRSSHFARRFASAQLKRTESPVWWTAPGLSIGRDLVPEAAHRMDQRRIEVLVDLAPQVANVDFHDIRERVRVVAPDLLEDLGSAHDLAGIAHQ